MAKTKAPSFAIRPATNDDLNAVVGIYNWAVNQTFATIDSEPLSAEEAKDWWENHGRRSKLIVATDNRSGLELHSKLGFETVGTIRNAANKFDRWMDITLVQRSLES